MRFGEFSQQCQASPDCPCDAQYTPCSVSRCPILKEKCMKVKSRFDVVLCVACDSYFQDDDNVVLCNKGDTP